MSLDGAVDGTRRGHLVPWDDRDERVVVDPNVLARQVDVCIGPGAALVDPTLEPVEEPSCRIVIDLRGVRDVTDQLLPTGPRAECLL